MTDARVPVGPPVATPITERLDALKALFPEAFPDGKFDAARLTESLGQRDDASPERFIFSWAGKREATSLLERPSQSALVPDVEASDSRSNAPNVFVEGDNLDVLLCLNP